MFTRTARCAASAATGTSRTAAVSKSFSVVLARPCSVTRPCSAPRSRGDPRRLGGHGAPVTERASRSASLPGRSRSVVPLLEHPPSDGDREPLAAHEKGPSTSFLTRTAPVALAPPRWTRCGHRFPSTDTHTHAWRTAPTPRPRVPSSPVRARVAPPPRGTETTRTRCSTAAAPQRSVRPTQPAAGATRPGLRRVRARECDTSRHPHALANHRAGDARDLQKPRPSTKPRRRVRARDPPRGSSSFVGQEGVAARSQPLHAGAFLPTVELHVSRVRRFALPLRRLSRRRRRRPGGGGHRPAFTRTACARGSARPANTRTDVVRQGGEAHNSASNAAP